MLSYLINVANSYTQLTYHAIFSVKHRRALLEDSFRQEVFRYMSGIISNQGEKSLAINGYVDHVHVLFTMPPTKCLADFMRDIKSISSDWINQQKFLPDPFHWQVGYSAFTCSKSHRDNAIKYILQQESHHKKKSFKDEFGKITVKFTALFGKQND